MVEELEAVEIAREIQAFQWPREQGPVRVDWMLGKDCEGY
jgi:hypothetical protein